MRNRIYIFHTILLASITYLSAFTQTQHIKIKGHITDSLKRPVLKTNITALFNFDVLATSACDENGFYQMEYDVYGENTSIDMIVNYKGYDILIQQNIPITSGENIVDLTVPMDSGMYIAFIDERIKPAREFSMRRSGRHYYLPRYFEPVFYHKKISYEFKIINQNYDPIPNAKVEIYIADDIRKPRWGITDENGNLSMRMDFENGALDGKIFISARGYKKRKLFLQKFSQSNSSILKLKRQKS